MSEKKTARLVPVLVEKRGKWVSGFKILSPDTGNELQPHMTTKDAREFCKAQGWEVAYV